MAAEELRRMTHEEFGALPRVEAIEGEYDISGIESVDGEWADPRVRNPVELLAAFDPSEEGVYQRLYREYEGFGDHFRFVAHAFKFKDYDKRFRVRGPRIDSTEAFYFSEMISKVRASSDDSETSAIQQLLETYGTEEELALVVDVIAPAVRRYTAQHQEMRKLEHVGHLNEHLARVNANIAGGMWAAAIRLDELDKEQSRSSYRWDAHLGRVDSFALIPEPNPVANILRYRPRIEPVISLEGESMLFPEDTLLVAATLRTQRSTEVRAA